jgi:hypothetical protein
MTISEPRWRKATRSTDTGGNCVEVADNLPDQVLVRDSKDPAGPALAFGPARGGRSSPRSRDRNASERRGAPQLMIAEQHASWAHSSI